MRRHVHSDGARGPVGAIACHLLSSWDVGEMRLAAPGWCFPVVANPAQVLGSWRRR
jgi:hypothetical protein